jgi:mxaJ protein
MAPMPPVPEISGVPLEFSMSMAVRKTDAALRMELDRVIERRRPDLDRILREYGVPRTDSAATSHATRPAP